MTRIVQPFQQGWTPINSAAFTPNELRLFQFKVDQDIQPDFITASWLGFLDSNSLTKKDYPLVRYLIENNLIPSIQNDMEMFVYGLTDWWEGLGFGMNAAVWTNLPKTGSGSV
ncbi:MAG: hypothetical protein WC865_11540 [Bacteroidales bacterium]